ncbi:MAG: cysteine-rich CWC family protein [Paludibacteraceae bacterium]|nr:cysteine-rich CWC family protein [Paludibacteraceae bacterium]
MKEKICPRCNTTFVCNHKDISQCQCSAITLSASQRALLEKSYPDCLCINCLKELFG